MEISGLKDMLEMIGDSENGKPLGQKFETDEKAIAHIQRVCALKRGDVVRFAYNEKDKKFGVFIGLEVTSVLVIFRNEKGTLGWAKLSPTNIFFDDRLLN